jgi:hypothetical protein
MQMATAAYRSSLPPDAARNAALGALVAAGWKLTPRQPLPRSTAFTVASNARVQEMYCLDDDAAVVNATAMDGVTYVQVQVSRGTADGATFNNGCNAPPLRPSMAGAFTGNIYSLLQYLPTLDAPADPASGRPVQMTLGSSNPGGRPTESMVRFTVKDSAANVARHNRAGSPMPAGTAPAPRARPGTRKPPRIRGCMPPCR